MTRHDKLFYEFGSFRIEKREALLRQREAVVAVPPKAIDVLLALVERGGEVVHKDELLRLVWPDSFVEEGSLTQSVSLLRRVLGDGDGSRYIETVPRRGYRFVAPVTCVREEDTGPRSLAVLPLANLSGDRAEDFFAEGMTDELISSLMKIQGLRVSSRTSVIGYKDPRKSLRQIARELDVDWVVEGTVMLSRQRVRIAAHLVDGATETQLWADTYENDLRDVLQLQREVATDIARQVRVNVAPPEPSRARHVEPVAYDAYLRGQHFWNKRTAESLARAVNYFQRAIDIDPTYAPAFAGLADTYALLGSTGYDVLPPREAMPRAKAAVVKALEIDNTMSQAYASLGYVKLSYDWDWPGAEEQFERALAANPDDPTAHLWFGHWLFAMARLDEAAREMRRALDLDPLSVPCNLGLGWSFYYARRFDEAIAQYHKTLEIAPDLPMVLYELGLACQHVERYGEAQAAFERGRDISGGEPAAVMLLGHLHGLTGRRSEARRHRLRLEELSKERYVPALYTAFIYVGEDEADQAFAWFEKAYEERSNYLIYLAVEPSLDRLRPDPRLASLARRVGVARGERRSEAAGLTEPE